MTITKVEDILSSDEISEYSSLWGSFGDKYILESRHHTHSGISMISRVFKYKGKPIFRAHVFNKKLRKFDPYFISSKYIHPFWHALHYFIVMEQMYHTSSNLIRDNSKLVAKDIPGEFEWIRPIFWIKTPLPNISIELILEHLGTSRSHFKEKGNFAIYDDKIERVLSRMSIITYWQPRAYIRDLEKIKDGDNSVIDSLIRKIKMQDINLHKRLIKPRENLVATKDYLTKELRSGKIPEEELHDFFSLWDKE